MNKVSTAIGPMGAFGGLSPVSAGVSRLGIVFVNAYVIDLPAGGWVLVDTGLPGSAWYVRKAVEHRYGPTARPEAIILTHAHFDHAGNAKTLAGAWNVPVYAHRLELPYLTGQSDYPPQDPTPGGAICFLSRFFPRSGIDLGERIHPLPEDGTIQSLPGWRWVHTPGHTVGHISLLRDEDKMLIAGDAIATTDLDAWSSQMTWPRKIARPATPFTPDWNAARDSIHRLAELEPRTIAAGHGLPISGRMLASELHAFADTMPKPARGRYADESAHYASDGSVTEIPPPVADPLLRTLAIGGAAALLTVGIVAAMKARSIRARA